MNRINRPAPFERVRTALARIIYCYLTIPTRIAIWLTPKNHPWRSVMGSTFESTRQLTWTTLRPRRESGEVEAVVGEPPASRMTKLLWLVAFYVAYATVARTTELVPALLPYLTDDALLTL